MPSNHWPRRISAAAAALLACLPLSAQSIQRVNLDSLGGPPQIGTGFGVISGDGSLAAFETNEALVPQDVLIGSDVYVHDRITGRLTLASSTSQGTSANDGSYWPAFAAGGRYVVFESYASNFVPGDTNNNQDIYRKDLWTGQVVRASVSSQGIGAALKSSFPDCSADGARVVFDSEAPNLVGVDLNGTVWDVFVRDVTTGTTHLVSVSSTGVQGDANSWNSGISANGERVAFMSWSNNLVPGDTNATADIFVHDLASGQTTRVSVASNGTQGNSWSAVGAISGDGRYVGFVSDASNLVPGDTNGAMDCFVHDLVTGVTERVSVSSSGAQASLESHQITLSHDGRFATFISRADDLAPNGSGGWMQIYRRDRLTGTTTRESVNDMGLPADSNCDHAAISADGTSIVLRSYAANLVANDLNGQADSFVRDLSGCSPTIASYCTASDTSIAGCQANVATQGQPSHSAPASFRVSSGAIPGAMLGLAFFGVEGATLAPVGTQGGLLCVGGTRYAAAPRWSQGTLGQCDGALEFGLDEWLAVQPNLLGPGAVVHANFWFRDTSSPDGFGTSDGVWFQVCP